MSPAIANPRLPVLAAGGLMVVAALRLAWRMRRDSFTAARRLVPRSPVPADVEISQEATPGLTPISELFQSAFDVRPEEMLAHGPYKGKLSLAYYERARAKPDGRYVVVVGINPTPVCGRREAEGSRLGCGPAGRQGACGLRSGGKNFASPPCLLLLAQRQLIPAFWAVGCRTALLVAAVAQGCPA